MKNILISLTVYLIIAPSIFGQTRKKLPNPINTPTSIEYAPSITADGKTLIYQSDQYGLFINANKKVPKIDADGRSAEMIDEFETSFFGVFEVKIHPSGEYMAPKNIEPINQFANENMTPVMGGPSVSYDGNTLFFFANFGKNGYGREDIYFSTREKNGWGRPENIGSVINTDGYEGFPSVSPDGRRLYFTREVLGKKVNEKQVYRIMVSEKGRNGKWKAPFELPAPVNTNAEKAPRIMADSKTLIFSRIKEGSKSDFDLYKSTQQKDGTWTEPIPLDFINTSKSDLFVSMSPCGDIMYYISNGDIYNTEVPQSLRPIKNAIVQGYVLDSLTQQALPAKLVIKEKASGDILAVLDNNPFDGRFTALIPFGADYEISVNLSEYFTKTIAIASENLKNCDPLLKDILLVKLPTKAEDIATVASNQALKQHESTIAEAKPSLGANEIVNTSETAKVSQNTLPVPTSKNQPIEELELVADTPKSESEKIVKEGVKIVDAKVISQLALILAIVNKETGEFISNASFIFKKENGENKDIKDQKNGSEYFFKVEMGEAFTITINAEGFIPFSAKIPAMTADRKVTIKMAPQQPSYLNINMVDVDTGAPLNGVCVIFSKSKGDSTKLAIIDGKAKILLKINDELLIKGRSGEYSEISQALKVEIPENGSKIYDLDLKLTTNRYMLELEATDIETGKAIPNAVFHVMDSKGTKIFDLLSDINGKIIQKLPKLDKYTVKCLAEGFKESEQQILDLKHNTKVLFKSVANKKRIHELKVLVYDVLTKEEIHPNAIANREIKGKAPFFVSGEENANFEIVLSGDGVKESKYKFAFNDSLINKVSTILYAKRNNFDFYFKALNKKTKDLVSSAKFQIIDPITKQEVQKTSPDGAITANLDVDKTYSFQINAVDFKPLIQQINPTNWVIEQEYERNFYIEPIEKITTVVNPNIVKSETFGDIEKGKSITLKNIYFDQSSPVLRIESYPELDQLIKLLQENPTIKILIKGHTDNAGDYKLNVKLSQERCEAVIAYMVKNKIEKSRLKAEGKGPDEPVSPNTTEESRRKNRRVEFVML
jgi:outer membrane protein OmpA-like peptidoglycan-associated protein/tRNA threonylcarbamoyladenosine modification (KEOPS) complex  Pcc1 subunit